MKVEAGGVLLTKGATTADGKRRKRFSYVHLRYFLFPVIATIFVRLVYMQFKIATIDIPRQSKGTIEKKLDGFRQTSARKPPVNNLAQSDNNVNGTKRHPDAVAIPNHKYVKKSPVLTAYLERPETMTDISDNDNLFKRNTAEARLRSVTFPNANNCSTLMQNFPIDDFPIGDGWLPWIHDYFPSVDTKSLHIVAQNRRKCDTGVHSKGKMNLWTPQVALLQGIPVVVDDLSRKDKSGEDSGEFNATYRLASSFQEATHNNTRFQCRFHHGDTSRTTLSIFPFDYEYVNWRKNAKTMFDPSGSKDARTFWLSQLIFTCPVPDEFQHLLSPWSTNELSNLSPVDQHTPALYVDLIPIRTPVRSNYGLLFDKIGAKGDKLREGPYLQNVFGKNNVIPSMDDAGRWENLPVCRRADISLPPPIQHRQDQDHQLSLLETKKPYRLVACTWTSASYQRRGNRLRVSDSAKRLTEWIQFHLMVGIDHIYIYDNTGTGNISDVHDVVKSFEPDRVTYHAWPCKICNNNRPAHNNPGERSSQYAAESSCRNRYGELSEWMTFIDVDEYMVPMKHDEHGEYSWHPVLDEMDESNISIMKFRSSRGKPRIEFTEELEDQSVCIDPESVPKRKQAMPVQPCIGAMKNKTFLQAYNCDFIRPPKPSRFERAMKQIYRPSFVLSHFVHYSTVTKPMTELYDSFELRHGDTVPRLNRKIERRYRKEESQNQRFMNELTQGALVHARSVLPHETKRRSAECSIGSKFGCEIGFLCGDDVEFVDDLHKDNVFQNADGSYCNCWRNKVIEDVLVPKLEKLLSSRSRND